MEALESNLSKSKCSMQALSLLGSYAFAYCNGFYWKCQSQTWNGEKMKPFSQFVLHSYDALTKG